jgi:hypothetical protein
LCVPGEQRVLRRRKGRRGPIARGSRLGECLILLCSAYS